MFTITIFFPDLSHYQAGLRIQPGTAAVLAKATEGTGFIDASYQDFKNQAASVGAVFGAYHYLRDGNAYGQAQFCYNVVGRTPLMLDWEANSGNVSNAVSFITAYRSLGGIINLYYLPHWYWQGTLGSPSLLPLNNLGLGLVSSNYTTYSDSGPGWNSYGGATPVQWQYSDNYPYGGQHVDFNAFRGSQAEYAQLLGATTPFPPAPSYSQFVSMTPWRSK